MWNVRILSLFVFTAVTVAQPCPDFPLPWGTYSGTLNKDDVCDYSNIRFASPPLGRLRFAAPGYPPTTKTPSPDQNPSCIQTKQIPCISESIGNAPNCYPADYGKQTEDCLFLDVSVPRRVLQMSKRAPVVVWFYGGAYLFGSKTQYGPNEALPFYDGSGMLEIAEKSNENNASLIFVRGNYRLGAFGWLAGEYMEKNGQPNAGLLDQRAILQFVQDHISKVNGDPMTVSVWGESAGASSIMHHLAMPLNIEKPLFKRAILQSPAYQWLWNRTGSLNDTFTDFAKDVATRAKCEKADMKCLQSADTDVLQLVNQRLFRKQACDGIMPVGPSVDGKLVTDLATNAFAKNNVAKIETIIVSHVHLEVPYSNSTKNPGFIPLPVVQSPQSEEKFQKFLSDVFTGDAYAEIRSDISKRYPRTAYTDQIARVAAVITDSSFTCNTRHIIDSYLAKKVVVYAMDYAVLSDFNTSVHASDLIMTFYNSRVDAEKFEKFLRCVTQDEKGWGPSLFMSTIQSTRERFQQYYTDHAIWGNTKAPGRALEDPWPPAAKGPCPKKSASLDTCVANVMWVGGDNKFFDSQGPDALTPASVCDFWTGIAQEVSKLYKARVGDLSDLLSQQIIFHDEQL